MCLVIIIRRHLNERVLSKSQGTILILIISSCVQGHFVALLVFLLSFQTPPVLSVIRFLEVLIHQLAFINLN